MKENELENGNVQVINGEYARSFSPAHIKGKMLTSSNQAAANCEASCPSTSTSYVSEDEEYSEDDEECTENDEEYEENGVHAENGVHEGNGIAHTNGYHQPNGHPMVENGQNYISPYPPNNDVYCADAYASNGYLPPPHVVNCGEHFQDDLLRPNPMYYHDQSAPHMYDATSYQQPMFYPEHPPPQDMHMAHPVYPPPPMQPYPPPPPAFMPEHFQYPMENHVNDPNYHQEVYQPPPQQIYQPPPQEIYQPPPQEVYQPPQQEVYQPPPFRDYKVPPPDMYPYPQSYPLQPLPPLEEPLPPPQPPPLPPPLQPPLEPFPPYPYPQDMSMCPPLPYSAQMPFLDNGYPLDDINPQDAQPVFPAIRSPTPEYFFDIPPIEERLTPLHPREDFDDQPLEVDLPSRRSTPAPLPIGDGDPEDQEYFYTNGFSLEQFVKDNDPAIAEMNALNAPLAMIQEPHARCVIEYKLGGPTPLTIAAKEHYQNYVLQQVKRQPNPLTVKGTIEDLAARGAEEKIVKKAEKYFEALNPVQSTSNLMRQASLCRKRRMSFKESVACLEKIAEFRSDILVDYDLRLGIREALREPPAGTEDSSG